jgi:peptide/nickel transport system substrate-binding protein
MESRPKPIACRSILAAVLLLVLAAGAGLLVAGGASAAASSSASPSASPGEKVVLHTGWTEEPDNLNPFVGYTLSAFHIFWENYDRLVRYDPATMKAVPGIAESWDVSPDAKTWTFHIRHGVKWQDGQDLTARDVAFTFNYVIKNAPNAFTIYTNHIASVTATDDHTVVFKCSEPRGTLLQMWIPILPEHIWGKISPKDAQNTFANKPPIIGSGPFQVVEWKRGSYVRLKAWKGYWGGAPKIDEMIMDFYTNGESLAADLDLGVIDMTNQLGTAQFRKYENKPGFAAQVAVHDRFDCMEINCYKGKSLGKPVLLDPKFRQALAWAIDNEKVCKVSYMGYATPGTSILPADFWKAPFDYHWEPPAGVKRSYDPEKAKQILDDAGYKDTDGDGIREYKGKPIELRLMGDPEAPTDSTTTKLISSWFKNIGVKVNIEMIQYSAQLDRIFNYVNGQFCPDYDLLLTYWGGDYDPGFLLSIYTGDQIENWNDTAWSNPQYDQLYKDQDATTDPQKRLDIIYRMQEIIYDQVPVVPFGYGKDLDVRDTAHWTGWVQMPAGNGSVANMWTYINVHPKTATTESSAGASTGVIAGVVVALCIGVAAAWLIARQRRMAHREEV